MFNDDDKHLRNVTMCDAECDAQIFKVTTDRQVNKSENVNEDDFADVRKLQRQSEKATNASVIGCGNRLFRVVKKMNRPEVANW